MILFRFTRRTILNSASLCFGVPLVLFLSVSFAVQSGASKSKEKRPNSTAQVAPTPNNVSQGAGKENETNVKNIPAPTPEIDETSASLDNPPPKEVATPIPVAPTPKKQSPSSRSFSKNNGAFKFLDNPPQKSTNPWAESNDRQAGDRQALTIQNVEYAFRWIPAGSFTMGSQSVEEGRFEDEVAHGVTLSHGFWMLETEITQEMWKSVMGDVPSHFPYANRRPVESVSWSDCQKFISKLQSLDVSPKGFKFALPTEAQWEYACRAGTTRPFSFGATLSGAQANFHSFRGLGDNAYLQTTTDVGSYPPNAWGLFDMHGNVWEWTADWYGDYPKKTVTDPRGPTHSEGVVCRGGCWDDDANNCRSARRYGGKPGFRDARIGFRIVLVPTQP